MHTFSLESGCRVRSLLPAIQAIEIETPRDQPIHANLKVSSFGWLHGNPAGAIGPEQLKVEVLGSWRPYLEGATLPKIVRA